MPIGQPATWRNARRAAVYAALLVGVLFAAMKSYEYYAGQVQTENRQLAEEKKWAIAMVKHSAVGSRPLINKLASEFAREDVSARDCDWHVFPIWSGAIETLTSGVVSKEGT